MSTPPAQALVHDFTSMGQIWHKILAHINYRALPTLRNIVMGLSTLQLDHDEVCRGCTLGKNTKGSFLNSENRSNEILDLVHSNLCGPMMVTSSGDYNYYV